MDPPEEGEAEEDGIDFREEIEFDEDADPVVVEPFMHEGTEYLRDEEGVLYDSEGIVLGSIDLDGLVMWEADREPEYEEIEPAKPVPDRSYDVKAAVKSLGSLYTQVKNEPPSDTVEIETFFALFAPPLREDTVSRLFTAFDQPKSGMIDLAESHDEPYTQLGSVLKRYRQAMAKLENLPTQSVFNLRALKRPPSSVKSTLKALAMLLGEQPATELDDWWKVIHIQVLSDRGVIARLAHFEKDSLSPDVLESASACIEWLDPQDDLSVGEIGDASAVVTALYNWTTTVVEYGKLVNVIQPQLDSLKLAAAELQVLNAEAARERAKLEAREKSKLAIQAAMTGRNRRSVKIEEARRRKAEEASGEPLEEEDDVIMSDGERALLADRQDELNHQIPPDVSEGATRWINSPSLWRACLTAAVCRSVSGGWSAFGISLSAPASSRRLPRSKSWR